MWGMMIGGEDVYMNSMQKLSEDRSRKRRSGIRRSTASMFYVFCLSSRLSVTSHIYLALCDVQDSLYRNLEAFRQ